MPAPSTATTVTSVMPIISAAAVDAVRPGLRSAFEPASSPATPPARRAGQPTSLASGFTSRGASSAMPMNSPITPSPSSRPMAAPVAANTPAEIAASDASVTPSPAFSECAAKRDAGSVEPSRTAAIGGTRVARRAGMIVASSVIPVPSSSDTITVRSANTAGASGRSTPIALNSASIPFAIPKPMKSPIVEATRPITRPSSRTERSTCLREAPRVRSVANSRVRWATVIDSVLKITNAPTNRAIAPKPSRK